MELILLELASQSIVLKSQKDLFDINNMLFKSIKKYKDIIEIEKAENVKKIAKASIGMRLK